MGVGWGRAGGEGARRAVVRRAARWGGGMVVAWAGVAVGRIVELSPPSAK